MRGLPGFSYRSIAEKLKIPGREAPRWAGPGSGLLHQSQRHLGRPRALVRRWVECGM